ncbi:MAG: DUF2059 domain-containing protein [Limisphaerales bacterium]
MKRLFTILTLTFFAFSIAQAEIAKEKRAEIEKMLQLTGMEKLVNQMISQMIATLKMQQPEVSETFWEQFQKKMDARDLIEQIIPVYDKYYTIEDLKAVNAFYESPVGQKVLATLPQVMQESMLAGQKWGEKIGQQAAAESMQLQQK